MGDMDITFDGETRQSWRRPSSATTGICRRFGTAGFEESPPATWSKADNAPTGWREDDFGLRPNPLSLAPEIRFINGD